MSRIALVSPYSWTYPGGVMRHIEALAEEFLARGHDVRVLAPYDPPDRLSTALHRGAAPERRPSPDYLVALGSHAPDVILSDYKLPLYGAAFALKMALEFFPDVPFMLVSDVLQDDLAGELLNRGARAYLSKSNLAQIGPAIDQALANTGRRNDDRCSMPNPGLS